MIVFSSAPGQVTRVVSRRPAQRIALRFVNPRFGFAGQTCICTSARLRQGANFQELHTLEDFAYVYSFGDKVADLQVGGYTFLQDCNGSSGVGSVLEFYEQNRLTVRNQPLFLLIGDRPFKCLLAESMLELLEPENGLAQFSFQMRAVADT